MVVWQNEPFSCFLAEEVVEEEECRPVQNAMRGRCVCVCVCRVRGVRCVEVQVRAVMRTQRAAVHHFRPCPTPPLIREGRKRRIKVKNAQCSHTTAL